VQIVPFELLRNKSMY